MKKTEFTYPSADGKTVIHAILWEPETSPHAVLQIAHGITEHIGRYGEFARYFTDRGYAVVGNDHLGHGTSVCPDDPKPMYFGPAGSWNFVTADIRTCAERVKGQFPDIPYILLGFSLGSFAVRCLLGESPDLADLTVWAGTGQTGAVGRALAAAVVKREEKRSGDTENTPLLQKLTMETYNKRFAPVRTPSDWLCSNPAAVDDYRADPLCGDGFTVGAFRELLVGMKVSASAAHVAKTDKTLPVLLISGKDDPVGDCGKGVDRVYAQLKKCGFADVEKHLFDGMRHDLFREENREDVFACIHGWIADRRKT